jgi:hypothetical protein
LVVSGRPRRQIAITSVSVGRFGLPTPISPDCAATGATG